MGEHGCAKLELPSRLRQGTRSESKSMYGIFLKNMFVFTKIFLFLKTQTTHRNNTQAPPRGKHKPRRDTRNRPTGGEKDRAPSLTYFSHAVRFPMHAYTFSMHFLCMFMYCYAFYAFPMQFMVAEPLLLPPFLGSHASRAWSICFGLMCV